MRRWATAILLGLSMDGRVDTTPTNPCGDKLQAECNDRTSQRDSVPVPQAPQDPPVKRNDAAHPTDEARRLRRQNDER